MLVPSYFLFLCYVHSSSCCINNTSFVATTTATTINLFTPTSLHVVAPHCAAPTLLSVEAADDGVTFDFQHNYLHSFSYKPNVWIYTLLQSVTCTVNYVILLLWTFSMFGTQDDFY